MTYLARSLILSALLLGPAAAMAEGGYSGTFTGADGGTATYSGNCVAGEEQISCSRSSLLTGPNGKTATRELDRIWTRDKVSTKVVTTGEGGRSVTSTRERLR
jgi:hypothetical protein